MSIYSEALDHLAEQVAARTGLPVTRDPQDVSGLVAQNGCVFIGMPTHVGRLLGGPNVEVPVSLVGKAPGGLSTINFLLDHLDAFVACVGAKSVTNNPLSVGDTQFPAVTAVAQIAISVGGTT